MFLTDIAAGYPTEMPGILGLWVALILMLMIYSYPLYKENIVYRFAEYTYIAVAMAIGLIVTLDTLIRTQLTPLFTKGQFILVIPIILGFMMYFLLVPDYRWVSRYPIAILVGSSMGVGLSSTIIPSILNQIINTIQHPGLPVSCSSSAPPLDPPDRPKRSPERKKGRSPEAFIAMPIDPIAVPYLTPHCLM